KAFERAWMLGLALTTAHGPPDLAPLLDTVCRQLQMEQRAGDQVKVHECAVRALVVATDVYSNFGCNALRLEVRDIFQWLDKGIQGFRSIYERVAEPDRLRLWDEMRERFATVDVFG